MVALEQRVNGRALPVDEITFRSSPEVSLGVELELQILDRDREIGELAPGSARILDACAEDHLEGVDSEFLLSMIEVKTPVCGNVAAVKQSLFPLLLRLKNITNAVGYDLALGGSHPFGRACKNAISPGERYQRIRKRQGWLAYHEALFGLHVHVGVPSAERALGLVNLLTPYLPHLLALSANSPFWQGVDTDFASARAALFRPSTHAGTPPYFANWREFSHYYAVMHQAEVYEATKDLYWDLRPRPDLGTIEFRICDAPASLSVVLAITALIRCLVMRTLQKLEEDPALGQAGPEQMWLAAENKFLAARYGLRAECRLDPAAPRQTLAEHLAHVIQDITPVARDSGEIEYLAPLLSLDHFETGAERLRQLYRQTGGWRAVIHEMKTRWARDLEGTSICDVPNSGVPAAQQPRFVTP